MKTAWMKIEEAYAECGHVVVSDYRPNPVRAIKVNDEWFMDDEEE